MLIDIGTNGEMVLAAGDHFLCSHLVAAVGIRRRKHIRGVPVCRSGHRRAVLFDKNNMVTKTIGNKPAIGLCGTGIIDVMYELVRHHIVDTQGILGEPWFEKGFPVVPGKIYFTQEDIRQVQMAKAAICAGLEVLLQKSNISHEQIKVYVGCAGLVWT
ncbi:MAG: ASKHA domain-containing protein [Roseburia intestinalis]